MMNNSIIFNLQFITAFAGSRFGGTIFNEFSMSQFSNRAACRRLQLARADTRGNDLDMRARQMSTAERS